MLFSPIQLRIEPRLPATVAGAGCLMAAIMALDPINAGAQPVDSFQSETGSIDVEIVTDGLDHPWGLDFLPDGRILIAERSGTTRLVHPDGSKSEAINGLPEIASFGQGGLLDVALGPDFSENGTVFFTYSEPGEGGVGTAAARARLTALDEAPPRLEDTQVIFRMERKTGGGRHFGSRVVVAPDGRLFVTLGDRGSADRAQDAGDHAGSIVRINADGSVPEDNPFIDAGGALPELWSIGHRNVQGADIDPATGTLIAVEHGARGGDEINFPEAGKNYGWPVISYGRHYSGAKIGVGQSAPGYEQPAYYWDPSIAPSGLAVYDGNLFGAWQGDILVGALKFQLLVRLDRDDSGEIVGEERLLEGEYGRIRDVAVAADGSVYLLTDSSNGLLLRLTPSQ